MEEEQRGGFFLLGGGVSTLLTIGAVILAINNPTISDLQARAASVIQQEAANSSNPFLSVLSQEIGRAGAEALTIRSTNYLVFTHFDVTTPDSRLFGGEAPQQLCFVGVMNKFYLCEDVSEAARQVTSSSSASNPAEAPAQEPTQEAIAASSSQRASIDLVRPQGWLCDGVRVRFVSAGDQAVAIDGSSNFEDSMAYLPYKITIAGQTSDWVSGFTNCSASCPSGPPQYFQPLPGSQFGEASFVLQNGLSFNDRPCEPVE